MLEQVIWHTNRVSPFNDKTRDSTSSSNGQTSTPSSENDDTCVLTGYYAKVLKISSYLGAAPLRFESHEKGVKVSLSRAKWIFSNIIIIIFGTVSVLAKLIEIFALKPPMQITISAKMLQLVVLYLIVSAVVLSWVTVYGAYNRMKNMLKYINTIELVDATIGKQYTPVKERRLFIAIIIYLIFVTFVYIHSTWPIFRSSWLMGFSVSTKQLVTYAVVTMYLQFLFLNVFVRARFQAINEALDFITTQMSVPVSYVKLPNTYDPMNSRPEETQIVMIRKSVTAEPRLVVSPSVAIQRIAYLRGRLCNMVYSINDGFGLPSVISLLTLIGNITVALYLIINNISQPKPLEKLRFMTGSVPFLTIHFSHIFLLVEPCHRVVRESKKTKSILCRMMMTSPMTSTMLSLLEMFSHQVMLRPASFDPMGICTLTRSLVVSLLGAVTTCLVLLIKY